MKRMNLLLAVFTMLFSGLAMATSFQPIHTIIIIRHAERTVTDDLSSEGKFRSHHLAKMLHDVPLGKIYSTNYQRTQLTVTPLAQEKNIPISLYDSHEELIETINSDLNTSEPQTIVIVGHSNTVADIIHALGGPSVTEIPETEFDHFFMLNISKKNVGLTHLHY